jgi:hypothetical protein
MDPLNQTPSQRPEPNTVVAAKPVDVVLVQYTDPRGVLMTSLAVVGESKVHLIDSTAIGFSKTRTPVGQAAEWLKKGIFEKLGRK